MSDARHWDVLDGDTLVAEVSDRPGPIRSTAPLPPGRPPRMHPFLSATARSAAHEDPLRRALEDATTVEDFLAALRALGLTVCERTPPIAS